MFDIVWQFWTWHGIALLVVIVVFMLLLAAFSPLLEIAEGPAELAVVWLIIFIVASPIFVMSGHFSNDLVEDQEHRERQEQDIIHRLKEHGHDVVTIGRSQRTVQIRSTCGEVWEYELEGDYSEGDLRINPRSEQHVAVGGSEEGVGQTCPSPYEDWRS